METEIERAIRLFTLTKEQKEEEAAFVQLQKDEMEAENAGTLVLEVMAELS